MLASGRRLHVLSIVLRVALAVVAPQTRRCSACRALLSFNSSFGNSAEMLYLIPLVLPMALAVVDCEHCEVKSASMIQRHVQKHGEDMKAQSCIASTTATCDTSAKGFDVESMLGRIHQEPTSGAKLALLRKYGRDLASYVGESRNHTEIMKNGTIDLHTLINDLIQKLLGELTESQASINASVDSFASCADHLKLDQALVDAQSVAMANTLRLRSETNSTITVSGNLGSTVDEANTEGTRLKDLIDTKVLQYTSHLNTVVTAVNEETLANQSLQDAKDAALALYSSCECLVKEQHDSLVTTVNSSSRLVHDNINLLKYLTCRLQNGKQSDSCSLSRDGGNSIDLRAGEVVLAADATCDQSSQVSQGSGPPHGPPVNHPFIDFASTCACTTGQNDACNTKCHGPQEEGGQTCFTYTDLGSLTWKACMQEASRLGATLCSEDYTDKGGWGGHRHGNEAEQFERFYSVKFTPITDTAKCVVGKIDRVTMMDRSVCSEKAEYDGDTWWYHDAGELYYDECVYMASSAGATVIDPSTIGQGDGTDYWFFTRHSGNVYQYWTGADTAGMFNVGCKARGGQKKCMFGFMQV